MKFKFKSTRLHLVLALVWIALMYPTIVYWSQSVLWVGLMSCYALFVGHVSSYEAARSAGVDDVTHARLRALAEGMADIMEVLPALIPEGEVRSRLVTKLKRDAEELRHALGLESDNE